MYTLKQLFKNRVNSDIKTKSTFCQKFYAMTIWVQNLQPSIFCLPTKRNKQWILRHVIELYAYATAE